jgi:hypothetical protein
MRVSHRTARLTYQLAFGAPVFSLSRDATAVLNTFHETFAARFPIPPKDLEAFGGNAMSDIRTRIRLFNGQVNLELFVDRFFATFENIVDPKTFGIVEECLELADQALRKIVPDTLRRNADYRRSTWFTNSEGLKAVGNLIDSHLNPRLLGQPIGLGLHHTSSVVVTRYENTEERWKAVATIEKSEIPEAQLYFDLTVAFEEGGLYNSIKQRADHVAIVLPELLSRFGVTIA